MHVEVVREQARGHWPHIFAHLGIEVGTGRHLPCPACGGIDRFRFDDKDGRGTWFCNQCDPHAGDGFALVMNVRGCTFHEALQIVAEVLHLTPTSHVPRPLKHELSPRICDVPPGELGRTLFLYTNATGRHAIYVQRIELGDGKKVFPQWGPTLDGERWQNNLDYALKPRPLYRLTMLLVDQDALVILHEGEKAVHAAINAALPGLHITTVGGASNPTQTDFSPLKGRDVVIVPDHDEPGEVYAQTVARLATEAGAQSVGMVRLPDLPAKGDVVEWLAAGGTAAQFAALLAHAETVAPAHVPDVTGPTDAGRDKGLTKTLADEILHTDHFAKDAGGQLYVFEGGCYRPRGAERIARQVKRLLELNGDTARWSSHRAREVAEYLRVDAPTLWERPPSTVMNLTNGLLDVTTGTLAPHSTGHLSPVQLPVTFDPSATCPLWESFTARVLPADCHALPFEIIASAMRGDVSDQKAALAVGPGDNGKSTLLDAIVAFLGRENVASLALHRLENDKFSAVRLLGKLANICADLPSDHLTSTSTFKALTGGDQLTAERKFQSSFEFTPFTRLIFSANHYPQSKDSSSAFFRRWLVIPFDAVIEPHERITDLAVRLADPGELSGVLNRALAVLPDMQHRGGFSQSETTQAAMMEFREMTDPLAAWLDRFTILGVDQLVSRKDLTIAYNAHAEASGRPSMTAKAFCVAVRRLKPIVTDAQRSVCGHVQWVFLGLGMAVSTAPDSHHSRDSHHFPQISLECIEKKGEREKSVIDLTGRNGVNGVNAVNEDRVAEEVLSDDR